jgi:hypothetical protein
MRVLKLYVLLYKTDERVVFFHHTLVTADGQPASGLRFKTARRIENIFLIAGSKE